MKKKICMGIISVMVMLNSIPVYAQEGIQKPVTMTENPEMEPVESQSAENILKFEESGNSYISLNTATGELVIYNKRVMNEYALDNLPDWYAYRNSIKKVIINGSLAKIGDYAFYGCDKLTSVSFNDDLKEVGEGSFYECKSLQNVTFASGLEMVDAYAFYGCSSLKEVRFINNGVLQGIENHAFALCGKLETIFLPDCLEFVEEGAFIKCASLRNVFTENCKVKVIGIGAFAYCNALVDIKLNMASVIEASAFYECTSLQNVSLPKVKEIQEYAFYECSSLKQFTAGEVEYAENFAFAECSQLENIVFGNDLSEIGNNVFENCTKLKTISFAQKGKLKKIGSNAFHNCTSLVWIQIPETVQEIGEYAFYGCSGLETIEIYSMQITFGENICKDLVLTMYFYPESTGISDAKKQNIKYDYFSMVSTSDLNVEYQKNWVYNGEQIKPQVTVKYQGQKLTENEDYILTYGENIVGTGTITIQGIHAYCNSVTKEFFIDKAGQIITYQNTYVKSALESSFSLDIKGIKEKAECSYSSSNQGVLSCEKNGRIKIKGVGSGIITVVIKDTPHYKGTVLKIKVTVKKEKQSIRTKKGGYKKYVTDRAWNLDIRPKDKAKVSYTIDNKKIASCNSKGQIKLKGVPGKAVITVKIGATAHYEGKTIKIPLKVEKKSQKINVNKTYDKYVTDEDWKLNVRVQDKAKVFYTSSNKKIAVCDKNGKIKLKGKSGVVTITVTVKETKKYAGTVKKIKIRVRKLPTVKLTANKTAKGFKLKWDHVKGAANVKYCIKIKSWSEKWRNTYSTRGFVFRGGRIQSELWVKIRIYDKNGRLIAQSKAVKAK